MLLLIVRLLWIIRIFFVANFFLWRFHLQDFFREKSDVKILHIDREKMFFLDTFKEV